MDDHESQHDAHAGQAVYSRRVLSIYDFWVLGISNRLFWGCPTSEILAFFNAHVTGRHLDIGVGTGYYLDRAELPTGFEQLTLMDLNENALNFAAQRVKRYQPKIIRHDALLPFPPELPPFDSVSMNFLLHCLPGTMEDKCVVFDHCRNIISRSGVVFGSTILTDPDRSGFAAERLMRIYQKKGIFGNRYDTRQLLTDCLKSRFAHVEVHVHGYVALFKASTCID